MLNIETTGLVLIDVQGRLARMVQGSEVLIANIEKLIKCCQCLNIPIIWLEQYPQGLGKTVPELACLLENNKVLEKQCFNGMLHADIEAAIHSLAKKQWLVAGIEAHICVYQSALGLLSKGYEVEVVTDCVSSRVPSNLDLAITKLQQKGAGITSVEMCVYELMKDSNTGVFKQVLPILK